MRLIFVLSMLWLLASPAQSQQTFTVGGVSYSVEKFLTANYPITLAFAPDGRLFYTEKISGNVRVVSADGVLQPAPVITLPVNALAEQGMLGIAIDPNFEDNGHIWVVHTNPGTTRDYPANRVVRFTERDGVGTDPEVMLEIPITGGSLIHNGGHLHFDREGRLYLTVGDYETPANAQNLEVMQGKIHRFDVTDGGLVPGAGTPLEGGSGYAYGLRNSRHFDFDTGESWYIYATANGDNRERDVKQM